MSQSVNKCILVGNLCKDPDVRSTQSGQKIVSFPLATNDTWNDKQTGEKKQRVEYHRVVVFNDRLADVAERFLRKGRKVYLEGALPTRKWTDQSGQERFTTEVIVERFRGELVLLDSRADNEGGQSNQQPQPREQPRQQGGYGQQSNGWGAPDVDDEIPF